MENKITFITVKFLNTHLKPIHVDISEKLQAARKLDYNFFVNILEEECILTEPDAKIRFLSSEHNAYMSMEKNFEISKSTLCERGLEILVSFKRMTADDMDMQLKSLKSQLKQEITKLENRFKTKLMLYDCLLLHKAVDNSTFTELINNFYSTDERKQVLDIIERGKELKLTETPDINTSENSQSLLNQISSFRVDKKNEEYEKYLDFGILYSEPLVSYDVINQRNPRATTNSPIDHQPVDFVGECNMILNIVKELNKNLNIVLKCLTSDSLLELINAKPKILHLICHGDIDVTTGEYYIECENLRAELLPLGSKKLQELLTNNENISKIKLIFINACHSQQIAQLFLDLGVECVVSIQKDSKIVDHISKDFAQYFFSSLLDGSEIEHAFVKATQLVTLNYNNNENEFHSCCCAHLHKEHCSWYSYARENGNYPAHLKHIPRYTECKCPNAYKNIHMMNCPWASNFMQQFMNVDDSISYEIIGDQRFICCCSSELPHNETMKFKIMYKNSQTVIGKNIIFPKNKIKNTNKHLINNDYFGNKQFFVNKTIGFNRYLQKMFNYFVNEGGKVALVKGERGSGKSSLVKHFANYCKERNKFNFVKLFEFEGVNSLINLSSNIESYLDSEKLHSKKRGSKHKDVSSGKFLLILDDLDVLISKNIDKIVKTIQNYIEMYNIYFIITISDITKNFSFHLSDRILIQTIEDLPLSVCAKIFLKHCQDQLPLYLQNYNNLCKNENFIEFFYNIHRYPKNIIELANFINNGYDIDDVLKEYKKIKHLNNANIENVAYSDINVVVKTDLHNIKFTGLIGRLSHGLIFEIDFLFYLRFIGFSESERLVDFLNNDLNKWLNLKKRESDAPDHLMSLCLEKRECGGPTNMNVEDKYNEIRTTLLRIFSILDIKIELTYFTFAITKINNMDYIRISRNQVLTDAIESINDDQLYFENMCSLINFVTCELGSVILNHKRIKNYFETDISFSAFSYHPNWKLPNMENKEIEQLDTIDSNRTYMQIISSTFIYILNENSFLNKLFDIADKNQHDFDFFYSHIEDFLVKFFSILMTYPYDEIIKVENLFTKVLKIVNKSEKLASKFLNLQVKLHILMTVDLLSKHKAQKNPEIIIQIIHNLNSLDSLTSRLNLSDEDDQELLTHKYEVYFLKIRAYKILTDFNYEKAIEHIYDGIELFEKQNYKSLVLRALYQVGKYKLQRNKVTEILASKIQNSIEESKEDQDVYLRFKLCLLLSKMFVDNREQSLKYLYIAREIADKMGYEEFLTRISQASARYGKSVNIYHDKRFAILVSSPIIKESSQESGEDMVDFKPYLKLKNKICDDAQTLQKSIFIDYERMTIQNIKKYLTEMGGCKVLMLYFNYTSSDHLILENNEMGQHLISYTEFIEFISKMNVQTETLIFINAFGNNTYIKNLSNKFQQIIYFEFKTDYKHINAIWLKKLSNMYIIKFCTAFFYEIFKGKLLLDAFKEAKMIAHAELNDYATQKFKSLIKVSTSDKQFVFKELRIVDQVKNLTDEGVCLVSVKSATEFNVYDPQFETGNLEGSIKQSRVFDNTKYAVGRKRLISDLHFTISSNIVINVNGEPGIGKTFLIQEYLFHASETNIYEYGIYYYSAPEIERNDIDLEQLIKEKVYLLCEYYGDSGMRKIKRESQKPKLLFVFDDFLPKDFLKLQNVNFKEFFNKIEVCFIFISTKMIHNEGLPFDIKYLTVDRLDKFEALNLILAIVDKRLFHYDNIVPENILFGTLIKKFQGKPKNIVDAKFSDIKVYIDKLLLLVKNKVKKETKANKFQAKKKKK